MQSLYRKKICFLDLFILGIFSLVFLRFSFLQAGEVVNTRTGKGFTNLQQALNEADSGDTLRGKGTFYGNFIIADDLTLEGGLITTGSPEPLILDAKNTGTVVTIQGRVVLKDLTIKHGNASGLFQLGDGGGIKNNGYLTLSHVKVAHNKANSAGGGIYNAANTYLIINQGSKIYDNFTSNVGGGMFMDSSSKFEIFNSEFFNNSANNGGGMFIRQPSTGIISNSNISQNTATREGGAIYLESGSEITLSESILEDNIPTHHHRGISGGGIVHKIFIAN
jgi:predicted outer membrane repeat protein